MKVLIIFDPDYDGEAADPVWIVDSSANRRWFTERREKLHPNSAIFSVKNAQSVVWNAQEHHPDWTELEAVGLTPTPEELAAISNEGRLTPTGKGFRLVRR